MALEKLKFHRLVNFRSLKFPEISKEFLSDTSLHSISEFNSTNPLSVFHSTHKDISALKNKKPFREEKGISRNIFHNGVKGQSPLLSHTIAIAFLLLLVIIVVSVLNTLHDDYSNFIGKNEISQVCLLIKGDVEKVFAEDAYISPTNTTKGKVFVQLPERIANQNYRVRFVNSSLAIETLSQPRVNDTCKPGFNMTYIGSTSGGRTEINFTLRDSGDKIISIRKV